MRFRDLIKRHKPLIFVILETRVSPSRAKLVHSRVSLRGRHTVEAEGFSGGIWFFWDSDIIQVTILKSHAQFIHARVKQGDEPEWLFTAIYGSPNRQKRAELLVELTEIEAGDSRKHWGPTQVARMFDPAPPRLNSDHAPLLIRLNGNPPPASELRPFRFQAAWLQHPTFNAFVHEKWSNNNHITEALEAMGKQCLTWNKSIFENIFARKKRLEARIEGIQRILRDQFIPGLGKLEKNLKAQLDLTLQQEETLWFQKSREKWIVQGDRKTKYFHTATLVRRRRNKIEGLMNAMGV
ncbi:reverse transcriptase [Gossypium australe]|uniref:Reverse transcriptase n=1 Tax=Gossypium australe TaxID=47621 RepID=A0A5B6VTU5_9ROSI|nr:reverse transcriptase [Gossypium australe]